MAAGREKNRWKVLRNVSDFAAVLQHSSLQELLNEHQSNGESRPTQQAGALITPQREAPERWVAVWCNLNSSGYKVQQYLVIIAISDAVLPC